MKKMLQVELMLMFMLTLMIGGDNFLFPESGPKSKIRFFSPGSFYIYVMGSYNHFSPLAECATPFLGFCTDRERTLSASLQKAKSLSKGGFDMEGTRWPK